MTIAKKGINNMVCLSPSRRTRLSAVDTVAYIFEKGPVMDVHFISTTHTDAVSVPGWTGAGYIIIDSDTGIGAYKIGGGKNGSFKEIVDWLKKGIGYLSLALDTLEQGIKIIGAHLNELGKLFGRLVGAVAAFIDGLGVYQATGSLIWGVTVALFSLILGYSAFLLVSEVIAAVAVGLIAAWVQVLAIALAVGLVLLFDYVTRIIFNVASRAFKYQFAFHGELERIESGA